MENKELQGLTDAQAEERLKKEGLMKFPNLNLISLKNLCPSYGTYRPGF